ncbi:hypothetical protein M2169_005143 [Streptomyces sp. MJP52]|nr:hypothetical protein [Streptomyces sp. MJP52]
MGTVHAGIAPDGTRVAVKVIHPERAQDPEFRARFRREVALSSRVTGPHLVPLLAADTDAETPWLATAYVPGPTLDRFVTAHGPLTDGALYCLAAATAQALAAIHGAGVVHRDVKPQNVLLAPAGPQVLDFGIAHAADGTSVTRTGVMTGTPGWISPEQYREGTAGPASDMFAWGALLAYAATGRLPFGTGAPDVVAFRVLSEAPDLDGLPAPLRRTVGKALSKDPADRPSAAEAAQECTELLAAQVTQVVGGDSIPATTVDMVTALWDVPAGTDPAWQPPARAGRPRLRLVGAVLLAGAVVGGLTGAVAALMPGDTTKDRSPSPAAPTAPFASADAADGKGGKDGTPGEAPAADSAAADDGSATVETWNQARTAKGQEEHDVARAVMHDEDVLARDEAGTGLTPRAVRFHASRREVYFSYVLDAPDEHTSLIMETEIARSMCLTLRDVVLAIHEDLPYRSYVLVRETRGGEAQVTWQESFVTDPECLSTVEEGTGDTWEPDETGLGEAMIPSSDDAEIEVADRTAKEIIRRTNGMRDALGTGRELGHEDIMVGFDPANSAMYVWSDHLDWNEQEMNSWASMAAGVACRALLDRQQAAGDAWPYSRYAVAEIGGSGYLMLRWDKPTTRADCPA